MKAPDKIYVAEAMKTEVGLFGLWTDKDHRDTPYCEYIRKDAILEWARSKMSIEGATEGIVGGYDLALKDLVKHIESL